MLAAASNAQPACTCAHTRSRHCALFLWGGGTGRALAARARRAALVGVAPCTVRGHCTSERPLSFGAWPCSDVPAAASNAKQAARLTWHRRYCTLSLSGEGAARVLAARARNIARVVVAPRTIQGHCTSERPVSYGARPCSNMPAAASNAKQAPRLTRRRRHCAVSLSGGGAERVVVARARSIARVMVAPCTIQGHCTSEAAACNVKQAPRLAWRRRHCALSLWRGGAARSRRGFSRSVHDSGATRRPWPRARLACLRVCAYASGHRVGSL